MTEVKEAPAEANHVDLASKSAGAKFSNTLALAARLACNSLWGMKLYSILTVLIIAAPLSICWVVAMKPMMEQRTARSAQVLGYDTYDSRAQRWSIAVHDFARVDKDVKAIAGENTVSVVTSPLNDVRDSWACSGDCLKWILWGPGEGTLAKTSQLVSGRWPTNSKEVLVSDIAVADGAQSSGAITLNVDGRQGQEFIIVGVGRTVLGQRNTVYTSILDEAITKPDGLPTDRQRNMWLFPGSSLNSSQEEQLKELGLTVGRRADVAKADFLKPAVALAAALTAFAALVCSQVFSIGLGRLRQSLNTIMQNGGNRRVTLACCVMQGSILGGLAAAVSSVVAVAAAVYVKLTPVPAFHPLGSHLRETPLTLIAALAGLTFLVTLLASLIPALTLRPGDVVEQAKTFSGREADLTFTKTRLSVWEISTVTGFAVVSIVYAAAPALKNSIPWLDLDRTDTGFVMNLIMMAWSLVAACIVLKAVLAIAREALYRKGLIADGVRHSLSYDSPMMSVASWLVMMTIALTIYPTLHLEARTNGSGVTVYQVDHALIPQADQLITDLKSKPVLSDVDVYGRQYIDRHQPAGPDLRQRSAFVMGNCQANSPKTFADLESACQGSDLKAYPVAVLTDDALTDLYGVNADQLTKLHQGTVFGVVNFASASSRSDLKDLSGYLLRSGTQTSEWRQWNVNKMSKVALDEVSVRLLPRRSTEGPLFLMSEKWLRSADYPLSRHQVLARSPRHLTESERSVLESAVRTEPMPTGLYPEDDRVFSIDWIAFVLTAGFGSLLALSSHKLTPTVRSMKDLGAGFRQQLAPVLQHSLFAGLAVAVCGVVGALVHLGLTYLPWHLAVRPYFLDLGSVYWKGCLYIFVIPVAAVVMAVPCTALWATRATRAGATDVSNPMRPVFLAAGVIGLAVAVLLLRGGI